MTLREERDPGGGDDPSVVFAEHELKYRRTLDARGFARRGHPDESMTARVKPRLPNINGRENELFAASR